MFALATTVVAATAVDQEWEDFKALHKKMYKDADEEAERYGLFQVFKKEVDRLNSLQGDMGDAEYQGNACSG